MQADKANINENMYFFIFIACSILTKIVQIYLSYRQIPPFFLNLAEVLIFKTPMQRFTEKLHLSYQKKDYKAIYDLLAPKMLALCIRYMGNRADAEDVLQDAFVTLFSKMDNYSGEGSFEGWARKIFVNTALMSLRKNDALKMSDDLETARNLQSSQSSQLQNIGYQEIMRIISKLPSGYRTVFNMYVIEGFSHKEISESLGISEATSRTQLMRARALLQEKIKEG